MEQERDRLAKQLADQADKHQAELQKLIDAEEALQAEFETHLSNWVDKEKALSAGYGEIEDIPMVSCSCPSSSCRFVLQADLRLLTFLFLP